MEGIGLVLHARELGVTEDSIENIAEGTFIMQGGYKVLTKEDIIAILKESL